MGSSGSTVGQLLESSYGQCEREELKVCERSTYNENMRDDEGWWVGVNEEAISTAGVTFKESGNRFFDCER